MKKTILIFTMIGFIAACKITKQPAAAVETKKTLECANVNITYSGEIKSILKTNCSKCHNTNNKAGYNFLTLESAVKGAKDGRLLGSIKHEKGFDKMPANAPKLPQEIIDKIECWINNGMKE